MKESMKTLDKIQEKQKNDKKKEEKIKGKMKPHEVKKHEKEKKDLKDLIKKQVDSGQAANPAEAIA